MARKSRTSIISSFVHVMVQGINKEFIFEENQNKKKYLNLLFSNIKKFNVDIISDCVMDNHSHLVFHFKEIEEISKLMHIINTLYAKWYNDKYDRVGYVFRDRYKIEEIQDLHHLYSCIKYVHNNPVKAGIVENPLDYKYSSYRDYMYHNGIYNNKLLEILGLNEADIDSIILNPTEVSANNINSEAQKRLEYNKKIQEFIIKNEIDVNSRKYNKEVILFLKNICNLKNIEISKIMNVNRKTIYRILKN